LLIFQKFNVKIGPYLNENLFPNTDKTATKIFGCWKLELWTEINRDYEYDNNRPNK